MGRGGANQASPRHPPTDAIMNTSTSASPSNTTASPLTAVRAQIKRGRTGCFTCRRRRKKCDETKPECIGCLRSGYICEGYPSVVRYEKNKPRRGSQSESSPEQHQSPPTAQNAIAAAPVHQEAGVEPNDTFLHWFFPNDPTGNFPVVDDGGAFSLPTAMDGTMMHYSQMNAYLPQQYYQVQQPIPDNDIPRGLPFLISGVESEMEQQFFHHFATVTSRVLTTSIDDKNPLLTVVLPQSLDDAMISKAISCLGGSHLANLHPDGELLWQNEKQRLLNAASSQQAARLNALKVLGAGRTSAEIEATLTSTLLLCLYEISEGSGNVSWRMRLDEARDLIQSTLQASALGQPVAWSPQALASLGVNQFLLDFFVYHDILAGVTDQAREPLLKSATRYAPTRDEAYMIGVDNGLFELIAKISALRTTAISSGRTSASVICGAIQLWTELEAWKPNTNDRDQTLAFSAYTSALFVWLYSIVYPDNMADEKVQVSVCRGVHDMHQIHGRGVLAFLLFPAFVLGFASTLPNQRTDISVIFERLSNFSALGNVKLAHSVVKDSWRDYDRGLHRSWDWMQQMETNGISLPVT